LARSSLSLFILLFASHAISPNTPSLSPAEVKAAFLKVIDRPRVPVDVKVHSIKTDGGYVTEHLSIASYKEADGKIERVPLLLVRPEKQQGRLPAVFVLHSSGNYKENEVGQMMELARRGMIGVAFDAPGHGERKDNKAAAQLDQAALERAWKNKPERPEFTVYDGIWDLLRTIDYLATRPEIDAERFGMMGYSMGGVFSWMAGALDDRVKAAVPIVGTFTFRHKVIAGDIARGLKNVKFAEDAARQLGEKEVNEKVVYAIFERAAPGLLDRFDCPSLIRLWAGRSLLVLNGEKDSHTPPQSNQPIIAALEEAYSKAGAKDRYEFVVAKGVSHEVPDEFRERAVAWFVKWLKD